MVCEGNNVKKIENKKLLIAEENRDECVFARADLKGDTLYSLIRFREIDITFSKTSGSISKFEDQFIAHLVATGDISTDAKSVYEKRVAAFFQGESLRYSEHCSVEQLYYMLHQIRLEVFGAELIEKAKERQKEENISFFPEGGIDQRRIMDEKCGQFASVIFILTDAGLFHVMSREIEKILSYGKRVYLVTTSEKGHLLPYRKCVEESMTKVENITYLYADSEGLETNMQLQKDIDEKRTCLFYFGEEGVITCRKLLVDSFVYTTPRGFHAQAVTGQLGIVRDGVVFIPAGFDIAPYVPLIDKTRLNYNVLYSLWKQYGMEIYSLSPEEMYLRYPDAFVNIYEDQAVSKNDTLIKIEFNKEEKNIFSNFDQAKENGIQEFLHGFKNLEYISAYFDKELKQTEPLKKKKQNGIYVHGIRVKCSENAKVFPCKKGHLLREQFSEMNLRETGIASNFLFFMTENLVHLYNNLRKDRPEEMSPDIAGYLDYKLEYRDGKRIETFPLFRKTCIAMKKTGKVFFFNFRLGGGRVNLSNTLLCWSKEDVDLEEETISAPICVFTPYLSLKDAENSTKKTYRKLVGQDRLNFVIYQDKIICCRLGDVVLPSVGVVLSIEKEKGLQLLKEWNLTSLENGYYDVAKLSLEVRLDKPDDVTEDDWKDVIWAYGGGLTLISKGRSLCDRDDFGKWLAWEGWTTPLSRQTQESAIHKLEKHPRTALGTTREGDLVVLTFSGRSNYSCGAYYSEVCKIANQLFPDIRYLMNVDGGASSVLGLVHNGEFLELNVPSTSSKSTLGMVRPVNTVLYVPIEKKEEWRGEKDD